MSEKEQAALAKKEYMREWRKNNKEKMIQYSDRYWAKKYNEQLEEEKKAKTN